MLVPNITLSESNHEILYDAISKFWQGNMKPQLSQVLVKWYGASYFTCSSWSIFIGLFIIDNG